VVCVAIGLFLPKRRKTADAAMLDSLSKA
jgi:hypothetical protein